MELRPLFEILLKQEKNLKSLLNLGFEKKEILINSDTQKLNQVSATEEQLLLNIQLAEEKRLDVMKSLFEFYNIENERLKLEILIDSLKGKVDETILDEIRKSENRIKSTIEKITKTNHINMVLIQQSRSLINETVQAVINASTNKIVDRKG